MPARRFSEQQVKNVLAARGVVPLTSLAKKYGVSKSSIRGIWEGTSYKEIVGPLLAQDSEKSG